MSFGAAAKCPRCSKAVYFAEQVLAPGGVKYHKLCFRCSDCGKSLDSTNMTDHKGTLLCKGCYTKTSGAPKGYGVGVGAGLLQTGHYSETKPKSDPVVGQAVNPRDQYTPQGVGVTTGGGGGGAGAANIPTPIAASAPSTAKKTVTTTTTTTTHTVMNRFGGGGGFATGGGGGFGGGTKKCPRCGKSVYAAEQAMGPGSVPYHKLCLRCSECGKSVDATTMAEHDNVIFCKACHGKMYGPKGYGYGGGAGTLTNTQ